MELSKNQTSTDSKLHFLDYWRIIRIRKVIIVAVFLLVLITVTGVTFVLPEAFSSTARIKVEKDTPDIQLLGYSGGSQTYDPYFLQTEFEVLKSRRILDKVTESLDLNDKFAKELKLDQALQTAQSYERLQDLIEVKQFRNTSIIEISAVHSEKQLAADIANSVARMYEEYRNFSRTGRNERGLAVLKLKLEELDAQVKAKQSKVDELRVELKVPDQVIEGALFQSIQTEELKRLLGNKTEIITRLTINEELYKSLQSKPPEVLRYSLNVNRPNPLLQSLLGDLQVAEQAKTRLNPDFGAKHPEVERVNGILSKINSQIDFVVSSIMDALKVQVDADQKAIEQIDRRLEAAKGDEAQLTKEFRPYMREKRDLETLVRLREIMMTKITQEEIDGAISKKSSVEVIDEALPGLKPIKPRKALNIALGAIAGIILGVGLAFFIEYLDTSVKTIDDVEQALGAPVLGVIPQNVGILMREGPDSPHAESYRVLRTNVLFSRKEQGFRTMTVVSGGAGEGKSTTIFNLATTFAQQGSRVLLVDSDLRRPSLHKILGVANNLGLTNYLLKQNSIDEVIQTTPVASLDFLPSGKLPSSSIGILNSVQMRAFIEEAKSRYDFVFFDSPPIMGVSDASILASEVDMAILVVQYRKYPQQMTLRAKQMVEKVGGRLLGVVLNNINISQDSYYYYYSGYYYDYYSKNDESKPADEAGEKTKSKA
jgi:capsular exopolysaccharide synthesis family protein